MVNTEYDVFLTLRKYAGVNALKTLCIDVRLWFPIETLVIFFSSLLTSGIQLSYLECYYAFRCLGNI